MLMGSKLIRAASHGLSTGESVVHGRAGIKVSTEHGVAGCATAQKLGLDGCTPPKHIGPKQECHRATVVCFGRQR